MIIDWQHHYCPPELLKARGRMPLPRGTPIYNEQGQVVTHFQPALYDIDEHLRFMDEAGIDKAVISMAGSVTLEESRMVNDAFAELMKRHPDRFVCLASSNPTKGEESLKELERAVSLLGLKGVCIDYQIEGVTFDSKSIWPFYGMVERLDVPVFIHIAGTRRGFEGLMAKDFNLWTTLGTMVIDQCAVARLILSGILSNFPALRFVVSHLGGGFSAIKDRFLKYLKMWGEGIWTEMGGTPPFPGPYDVNFQAQFTKLYFDMAGYEGGMGALLCALTSIDPSRLLFGTDYPFNFTDDPSGARAYIENIKNLDLPESSKRMMLGENAENLLTP